MSENFGQKEIRKAQDKFSKNNPTADIFLIMRKFSELSDFASELSL